MNDELKDHLPTIIATFAIGIAACAFALLQVYNNAGAMNVDMFSMAVWVVPCVFMVICSFVIMVTANAIGRKLFLVVVGVCFVAGVIEMVLTSTWFSNPDIVSALLANSGDGAEVVPPINNPIAVMRDIAAFIVAPTVGSIFGAWLGSRLHPMKR